MQLQLFEIDTHRHGDLSCDTDEVWLGAHGFGRYEVSSMGRFRSVSDGVVRDVYRKENGYSAINLRDDSGRSRNVLAHRVVAFTFFGEPGDAEMQVNHVNGDRADNRVANLEWVTASENMRLYGHRKRNGVGKA